MGEVVRGREWHFKVRQMRDGSGQYLAWCARTPDLHEGPLEISLTEEVHFEFGATEQAALQKLKAEVLN